MYKFSKLVIKNAIFALTFIIAIGAIAFSLLTVYIKNQTQEHQQTIQTISQQFVSDNESIEEVADKLAAILTASTDYQTLIIKNNSITLFNFQSSDNPVHDFVLAKRKAISAGKLNLQVQYKLAFTEIIKFLTQLFIGLIALSAIFVLISARLNYKLQSVIFSIISRQISNELAKINDPDFITNENTNEQLLEIPALQEGIAEIRAMMTEQFKHTTSLEMEAHVDSLTGIENRNRFVQFYEKQIVQESPVKFGVLLITRCSELQTINQVHGYNSGDNYIIKVAEIIKNA
ncbi:MAG: GGDEF domain-containing protein [Colwellia sp.]|nr:GGDEF domain-containing protein [Colwellia sp.]